MKNQGFAFAATTALILAAGSAFAEGAPVAGETAEGSLAGKTLSFVSWGGIYQDGQAKALEAFVAQSGATLLQDGPTEVAKLKAQVDSGNVTWDVVDTGDLTPYVHCGTLFQKLDLSKIDVSNIPDGQVGPCSVPAVNYGVVLMYNAETYGDNPPTSWSDFFDTAKFPGLRAIDGTGDPSGPLIELGLIAAGGSTEAMTVADIDTGIQKIRDLGEDTIYYKTGAESQQLAESGEADMIMMWSGRAMEATKNGAKFTPVWQDWIVAMDQLAIPMGVKDSDAAHALINAYLGKETQEIVSEMTSYSPVNTEAQPELGEAEALFLTSSSERLATAYYQNIPFWVENAAVATEKWNELLSGN